MRTTDQIIRDFGLYVLISLIVIGGIFTAYFFNVSVDVFARWFAILALTAVLFGSVLSENRDLWHKRSFWVVLIVIFMMHCGGCVYVAVAKINFNGSKAIVAFIVETAILVILRAILYGLPKDRGDRPSLPKH